MSSSPHHHDHLREKTLRRAQREETPTSDIKTPKIEALKVNMTSEKVAKENRGKASSHHVSKRTSPDTVHVDTEPQHLHKEGFYWIKTLHKQVKHMAKRLSHKLMHRKK